MTRKKRHITRAKSHGNGTGDNKNHGWVQLQVESTPPITDPRELETIVLFSLRNLWGDLESHSCMLEISKCNQQRPEQQGLLIGCPNKASANQVRAALTWLTLPPYMQDTLYRIDVISSSLESLEEELLLLL